ncbi:hypothetical protein VTH82DRAFT_6569 [Thermothelomyces myriococcoides]
MLLLHADLRFRVALILKLPSSCSSSSSQISATPAPRFRSAMPENEALEPSYLSVPRLGAKNGRSCTENGVCCGILGPINGRRD